MDCSMPGFSVLHCLPEFAQTHVHWSPWCHPTISSSVAPFSSCPPSFPASGSFSITPLFESGGQRTGASASASALPMNIHCSIVITSERPCLIIWAQIAPSPSLSKLLFCFIFCHPTRCSTLICFFIFIDLLIILPIYFHQSFPLRWKLPEGRNSVDSVHCFIPRS